MRTSTRLAIASALTAGLLLPLAGCGIDTDDAPRALPTSTTTTTTPRPDDPGPERAIFWFVQAEKLVPVLRPVSAFSPDALMETLLLPLEQKEGEGLSNAIPAGTELLGTETRDGIVEVDLSAGFEDVVGPGSSRAIGQIVMTLTGLEEIEGVRFAVDGEPIQVTSLDPDRGTVQVVNACDYAELLAEPLGETTNVSNVQQEILETRRDELEAACPP